MFLSRIQTNLTAELFLQSLLIYPKIVQLLTSRNVSLKLKHLSICAKHVFVSLAFSHFSSI